MPNNNTSFVTRHRWLTATVAVAAAVVLFASLSRDPAVPVRAVTAQRGTIRSVVSTNGRVEPLQNFEAHAPIGTTVRKLLVREGEHVKKGRLLVQLNDAQAQAQVLTADAEFSGIESGGNREEVLTLESQIVKARTGAETAQRNLDALRRLRDQGAASPGEVKNAEDQ